jgi:hypothetical protein
MVLGALAAAASLVAIATKVGSGPAKAASHAGTAVSPHVVIVGISGLRWSDISASATPALWTLARAGSPGSLVDYAVLRHTCPADAWPTLNVGDRAQVPHTSKGPCPALPAVTAKTGHPGVPGPAKVAAMPSLVSYNHGLRYSPRWGLLASAAGRGHCATAVGPGAALALAGPDGNVGSYLPAVAAASRAVLARCPLTVVDLGSLPGAPGNSRAAALRHADTELAAITAGLPVGTTLMVTAVAGAVPAGSFLANLVPWWLMSHSAIWQYGLTLVWTAVVSAIALAGPWRRDPFGPPGAVALMTVLIVGLDVMTGSRLQMGSLFGLSALEGGRFYGIGGEAIGLYTVCGMIAVAVFVVIACGWPQFGGKVGGTIAIVPCFLLLLMAVAGIRITVRRVAVVLGSGVALLALFATTLAMMWLVCVLGWVADDSGIIVPATALPLALPLGFALLAGVPLTDDEPADHGPAVTESSVAGRVG